MAGNKTLLITDKTILNLAWWEPPATIHWI